MNLPQQTNHPAGGDDSFFLVFLLLESIPHNNLWALIVLFWHP